MDAVFLKGNRVSLRPFSAEDAPFFLKWYNDPATRSKIGEAYPCLPERADAITRRTGPDYVWFAVVRNSNGAVIGEVGLLRMVPAWRTTDLTIILPDRENQHKGYGTEAIHLLLDYAFGALNFNRVAIGVVGFNEAALAFYEKIGFRREGIQQQGYYYNFQYHDFVMMRLLRQEYMALRGIEGAL